MTLLIAVSIALVLMGLSFVPFAVKLEIQRRQAWTLSGQICWGSVATLRFPAGPSEQRRPAVSQDPAPSEKNSVQRKATRRKATRGKAARTSRSALATLRSPGFSTHLARFVKRFLSLATVNDLRVACRVGLGDPASTGYLFAAVAPVVAVLNAVEQSAVLIQPEFIARRLDVDASATLRIVPGQCVATLLAFALSPTTLRAVARGARVAMRA